MQDVGKTIKEAEAVAFKLQGCCQRLRDLEAEKAQACCQIKDIENEISCCLAEMDMPQKPVIAKTKAPKAYNSNEHTLVDILVWLIGSQKIRVPRALAMAAQDFGFVTSSKDFRTVVHQALRQTSRFKKIRSGVWGLSKIGSTQYARQCKYNHMR